MKPILRPAIREFLLVAALAFVAVYGFFCEYLPPFERVHLFSDIEGYHLPLQRYALDSLKSGRFPTWDPSIYCGVSFVGNVQAALLYPPSWAMYAASWRRDRLKFKMLQDFVFVHFWLAYLMCWLWLRGRGLARLPSAMGSAVFAFGGYMCSQCVHVGVVSGLAWMPLGLWGIDQAAARADWRPLWKTAAASALCFLAGYPPSWFVFCFTCGLYALVGPGRWRAALGACAAIAASVLLAMVQWLPALEASSGAALSEKFGLGTESWRAMIPYFIPNFFDSNPGTHAAYPIDTIHNYVGLPAILALVWAIGHRLWRPMLQPAIVAAACLVMATNPLFVMSRLIERVGVLERALQTYNFYEGAAAMAALLAALGLHHFLERPSGARASASALACIAAAAALAWAGRQLWTAFHGGQFAVGPRAVAETLAALAIFSAGMWTLRASVGPARALLAASLVLMVWADFKVFGANRHFNTVQGDLDKLEAGAGLRGMNMTAYHTLMNNREFRVVSDGIGGPAATDYRMWGLASPQGFDPFLPRAYRDFIEQWVKFETNRLFQVDLRNEEMMHQLGVRFVITHQGLANSAWLAANPRFHLLGPDDSFYRIYDYDGARPPFGWVDAKGDVDLVSWRPGHREFQVFSPAGGRFFLGENFFDGWSARVDRRDVPLERWNRIFQAVRVPPGEHTVAFVYRDRLLVPGAVVSVLAALALAVACRSRKKTCKPR